MWSNWSGEQTCAPRAIERPRTTAEVAAAIERAAGRDEVVRVAGAGHSFADAVLTEGTLLRLDAMDRIVHADPGGRRVRVQAGISLRKLSDGLARYGLALENMGDVDPQSIAGATATGTHGTGATLKNLSSAIEAVQLVDGHGRVHELDGGDDLRAARVSVGALGVVTEVTLSCVPAYTLTGVDESRPLDETLAAIHELAAAHRHFELYVFPHTRTALTRTNDVVGHPPRPESVPKRLLEDELLTNGGLRLACELARRRPRRIPQITNAMVAQVGRRVRHDRSDRIFTSPRRVRFTEMEQAFPREAVPEVIPEILATLERHPVVFPIEVRFVAGDDALLSPAGGRETAYVAVHNFVGMPWEQPFREVQAIGDRYGARPHWGKRHFHDAASLAPRYPEWDAFQAVRRRLDPDGRFTNGYVRRVLG